MTVTTPAPAKKRSRRWLWRSVLALVVALVLAGTYAYFEYAWVFFVEPTVVGEQRGLPMTVIAGNGEPGFADGQGSEARLAKPIRLAPYGDDAIVFADIDNHAVRIAHADGRVETIAGGPERHGHADGPGEDARFDSPHGIAVRRDGAIAVCEAAGGTVRLLVDTPGGWIVSTLAGVPGESGMRDGPGEQALFDAPHAVAWGPDGELYVADIGNGRIRLIREGDVSTVAGGGASTGARLRWPMDIALDENGVLWIADAGQAAVLRWSAVEGLVAPFPDLELAMPHGIAVEPSGHVALAEMYAHRVLRIDARSGDISTYCTTTEGTGPDQLNKPAAVLIHAGRLWIADLGNHRIAIVPLAR